MLIIKDLTGRIQIVDESDPATERVFYIGGDYVAGEDVRTGEWVSGYVLSGGLAAWSL